jgi:hypothetical protein
MTGLTVKFYWSDPPRRLYRYSCHPSIVIEATSEAWLT